MKKALSLLLALVMCLALCACGSKEASPNVQNEQVETTPSTQEVPTETTVPESTSTPEPTYETVEITMDNWQEYFEFRTKRDFMYSAFNELTEVDLFYYLVVKDGIVVDCYNSEIAVEIEITQTMYEEFTYNEQTQELAFWGEGKSETITCEVMMRDLSFFSFLDTNDPIFGAYYLVNGLRITDTDGSVHTGTYISLLKSQSVVRIQGTLSVQTG